VDTGYDVTKPPSTMQMMKMGLDGDLRRGATKVSLLEAKLLGALLIDRA